MVEQRPHQLGAAREVHVDGTTGDAGALGDRGHGQRLEAALLEQRMGCGEQRGACAAAAGVGRLAIYYSSTGNVHALAEAVAEGAAGAGADVRLRRAAELAPAEAIDTNPAWRAHADATAHIPEAAHDDLRWADAFAFGTPARYGNVCAQLKQFLDTTAPLWAAGELADEPATAFTSAINAHGGNESTLLALYNSMYHWGAVVVAPGYTHPAFSAAGGDPYGTAHAAGGGAPGARALEAARRQGERLARVAALLRVAAPASARAA